MKTIKTIKGDKAGALVGFVLAVMCAISGVLAVQNSSSRLAAAAVVESANAESTFAPTDAHRATDAADHRASNPVVENRMTEEAKKAAARAIGRGEASYYGPGFAGRPTANGETFNPAEMTAAHRTLPFGTKLRVTNTENGRSIVVRVNDRGPYAHNRVIDLSKGAAEKIGMIRTGTAQVKLEVIS